MSSHDVDPGSKSHVDDALDAMDENRAAESPAEDIDPANYRDLTKEEVLDRIAAGYKSALAGDHISFEELLVELDELEK